MWFEKKQEEGIMSNEHVTEHFKFSECTCPCCDRVKIIPGFFTHMEKLEQIRQVLGFPIVINSGYRCPPHNEEVGGSANSWHMKFATDIQPHWGEGFAQKLKAIYKIALTLNFGGIGYYTTFIHLDLRPGEVRWRG